MYSGGRKLQSNLELSQLSLWNNMNLDSLSFALAEISYSVANLTKKNFRSSVAEITHVRKTLVQISHPFARIPIPIAVTVCKREHCLF